MDSMKEFMMGEANRGREMRVFDWDRAARRIVESGAKEVWAGLRDDWEYTGGTIFEDGKPVMDSYTYLASEWAVPELELDGQVEECWRMESETPEWDEATKWPQSALDILEGRTVEGEVVVGLLTE